ncbi:uncharacterized protein LOC116849984 [Odontomachus brunneus]|uniref:uncharacterized protein LOC116849984 n=1 Tax=Odontomachus brunneus TaxID=486640 RepID=UPI0013F2365D|nr:uncharacterized protein LOC116849984 [Odontomachus brunneus]
MTTTTTKTTTTGDVNGRRSLILSPSRITFFVGRMHRPPSRLAFLSKSMGRGGRHVALNADQIFIRQTASFSESPITEISVARALPKEALRSTVYFVPRDSRTGVCMNGPKPRRTFDHSCTFGWRPHSSRDEQAVIDCHEVDRNGEKGLEKPGVEGWLNWTRVVFLTSTHPRLQIHLRLIPVPALEGMKDE